MITLFYDRAGNVPFFVDDHQSSAYWYLVQAWPYKTGFILDYTRHVEDQCAEQASSA